VDEKTLMSLFLLVSSTHKKLHSEVGIDGNACSTQVHAALLSSFEPVFSVRCLASLDHRTGVEQPTDDLIIQNRKAVQSIARSINWTLEDNMVKGLFFCATLTNRRGTILHLCNQERICPTLVWRRLSRIHAIRGSAKNFIRGESITL